jgi:hypothetical protein
LLPTALMASAKSAMMPPSPWLSARRISVTYFSETTIISDQKMTEITPITWSGVSGMWPEPANTSCTV